MLVKDIIKEPLDINTDLTNSEKNEKVDWLLNKVGLNSEQSTRYPHEFSEDSARELGLQGRWLLSQTSLSLTNLSLHWTCRYRHRLSI